ncbi:kinase-like protein [Neolentinus lepideus HHB14362 ss-1]|uniref:Kinase-like protein n=1 Tax=Neolentinus lepideus HHB14362 ss-1 TaxID=1314782 RepID=A0A165STT9_9AGAM|nr:kinase-like protein [Neolentinus lepideus HHB14362 ss-1]
MEDKASAIEKFVAEFSDICHPDIAPTIFLRAEPSPTHHGVLLKIDRQYYPNGNIIEWLKMHPDDLIPLAIGAANGLEHLHSKGMVHGGICGDRVFVDNAGQAVLVDPGLAAVTGTYDFRWLAPEVMQDESDEPTKLLTKESDVYAFGIMLSEMISPDETPFSHIKGPKICLNVARGGRQLKPQGMSAVAQQLWNLAEKCWHPEPCERHSMHAVIQELIRLAQ